MYIYIYIYIFTYIYIYIYMYICSNPSEPRSLRPSPEADPT